MKRPTVDALGLIRSLEPLARRATGTAALIFDADGTLWTGDVGVDTFTDALEKRLLRDEVRDALIAEIFEHGLASDLELEGRSPEDVDVNLLGQQLHRAFELGRYPEQAATEMQVWAYAGWSERELREHARESLNARQHITQVFGPLLPVLIWARDAGLRTVIVSASPQIVVEEAARTLGFAPKDITAGRAKSGPQGFLPELASPLPYGPGKVRAGRLLLGTTEWLAAFGDSGFDAEMLSQAKLAVAVRPRAELLERLDEIPGAVLFDGAAL
jgi:phosphoserine phosphatase